MCAAEQREVFPEYAVILICCVQTTGLLIEKMSLSGSEGEGTQRKLATATQPQFPRIVISLS
jgi:hypothetical protein